MRYWKIRERIKIERRYEQYNTLHKNGTYHEFMQDLLKISDCKRWRNIQRAIKKKWGFI